MHSSMNLPFYYNHDNEVGFDPLQPVTDNLNSIDLINENSGLIGGDNGTLLSLRSKSEDKSYPIKTNPISFILQTSSADYTL